MKFVVAKRTRPLALLAVLYLLLLPTSALAYIDPGTGSFVIQGIIGAIVGGAFAVKLYWKRIKARFSGKPMDKDEDLDD
jgi:hypothetical protein